MDNITNYEYIKNASIEEIAVIIRDIQINALSACGITLKEDREEHCKKLLKWLNSEVDDG